MPTEVIRERPSGATATPSSSVGPNVICSGSPEGQRCRHMWKLPPAATLKYIQRPSGDHPPAVHLPGGPTWRPSELPSNGTTRHGIQVPLWSISTSRTHRPAFEGED